MARQFHACTHTTIAPTVVHGGTKTNVIPDRVDLELDIRTLPGQTAADVRARCSTRPSATSPTTSRSSTSARRPVDGVADRHAAVGRARRGRRRRSTRAARSCPILTVGATDARFFRRARRRPPTASGCSASSLDARGLRHDVPRRRRAGRRRVAAPVDRAVGGRRPRPARRERASSSDDHARSLWDFGGVLLVEPVRGLRPLRGRARACPPGFLRRVNATNPDTNAWARLERNEVDLDELRRRCSRPRRRRSATRSTARDVLALLAGDLRPEMVEAVRRCGEPGSRPRCSPTTSSSGRRTMPGSSDRAPTCSTLFDVVVESSQGRRPQARPARSTSSCCERARRRRRPRSCSSTTSASTSSRPGPWA